MAWNGAGFLNPLELSILNGGNGADQFKGQGVQTRYVTKYVGPDSIPTQVMQVLEPATGQWADATDNGDGSYGTSTNTRTSYGFGVDNAAAGGRINPTDNDQVARRIDNRYASNGSGGFNFDGSKVVDYSDPKDTTAQFLMRAIPSIALAGIGAQTFLPGFDLATGLPVAAGTGQMSLQSLAQRFGLNSNSGTSYDGGADGGNPYGGDPDAPQYDYSNEGRNYPTPESTQGPGGSPSNASLNAPALPSPDYSNEGRNYPTQQSTQGPGGAPVNAPTPASGSGLLDSIKGFLPEGASKLIVPAAVAALSYAGSKPATPTGGLSNPDIGNFFTGSLMPGLTSLLQTQAPRAAESSGFLAQRARSLLDAPVAGNGFSLLSGRKF